MNKKQRDDRRHQEDLALTRALLWVAAAVVLEGLLVFLNRFYINYHLTESESISWSSSKTCSSGYVSVAWWWR